MGLLRHADKTHRSVEKFSLIMIEIIPAINADNFEEIKKKIKLVESCADWAHIDVADGTFTKNTLWHNASDLASLDTKLNIEVHLMINNPERRIDDWLISGVKRVFFHIKGCKDPGFVINRCKEAGVEAAIAVGPDESVVKAMAHKDEVKMFLILGVHPGLAGQKMNPDTYGKIKEVRSFCGSCIIGVDGGMNRETMPRAAEAGADRIISASAVFESGKSPEEAIGELKKIV